MNDKLNIWLEAGLNEFARHGPESLKVEKLAAKVGKSRSSFYHLFGDMEGFRDELYAHYLKETMRIAALLDTAKAFYPDFAELLGQNKDWAFTHIHMHHYRERCDKCGYYFAKGTELIEKKIQKLWTGTAGLEDMPMEKTQDLYRIIREAIFTKLNYDTYSPKQMYSEIEKLNESLAFLLTETPT